MEICKNCLRLCTINFELFIRQDGSMKRSFYIVYTLVFLWAQSAIHAQDSLFFIQVPGQKLLTKTDVSSWGGGGGFYNYVELGEVTFHKSIYGKQYYNNPFLKVPMAYDAGKVYWLDTGDDEKLMADFALPSGSTYTGSTPYTGQQQFTLTKSAETFKIQAGTYSFYFKKNMGLVRLTYSITTGYPLPRTSSVDMNVKELTYTKPDGSLFVFNTPPNPSVTIEFDNAVYMPRKSVKITAAHPYSGGYTGTIDFWLSVVARLDYVRGGDTVIIWDTIPRKYKEFFADTLIFNESLLKAGYTLAVHFILADQGPAGNLFKYGGAPMAFYMRVEDLYSRMPSFVNYYTKWHVTGSDTTYQGIVEQTFTGDTAIGMVKYGREELFGELLFIAPTGQDLQYKLLRNKGDGYVEFVQENHKFNFTQPAPLHYLEMGERNIRLDSSSPDSSFGVVTRVYHFIGGYLGDEEVKYKARTGPLFIKRYESDGNGTTRKVLYNLWKANNRGVIYFNSELPSINPPAPVPDELSISNNYPNPFNPATSVIVTTVESSTLTFTLYNSSGEEVSRFSKQYPGKGQYVEQINLSGHPSGAWFMSVTDHNGNRVKLLKLVLIK